MRVSVVIGTYNGEDFIAEQLDSIVRQSKLPDQVIISDDNSDDGTIDILSEAARELPMETIILESDENRGYTANFSRALQRASGDIVFLCDQDDVWKEKKIEICFSYLCKRPDVLLLMHDADIADSHLNLIGHTVLNTISGGNLNRSRFVLGCCAVVRRELLDLCLPIPYEYYGHDGWLVRFADALGGRQVIEKSLIYYRRHCGNVTGAAKLEKRPQLWNGFSCESFKVFERYLLGLNHDESDLHVQMNNLYLSRIRDIVALCDGEYKTLLSQEMEEIEKLNWGFLARQDIKRQGFAKRFASVVEFYRSGEYSRFSGIKSAFRDIFG